MLQVVDHGWTSTQEKSGLCSAEWTGFSHLGLNASALILLIKMTVVGNNPFGSKDSVVLWSLSLSLPLYISTQLASRALCTKHVSSHFIKTPRGTVHPYPPRGRRWEQHLNMEPWLCTDDWPTTEIFLSTMRPFLILSTSHFNFSPSCKKKLNEDDISA